MSQVAIRVEGLGKRYRLGQQVGYKTLREALFLASHTPTRVIGERLLRMRHAPPATSHEPNHIWALKDVSFEVKRGEAIGIIGRNGSGKSTLLKILSRITAPTEGCVEIHGRVGSLLEVGTGFHPELTGRENIYLNGAIIGMRKAEIERRFDEIVAFAEIEKFLDTPVKRYSSGMYVRLAFAVAAHLEPDVLIVDEVLAVGDAEFQRKCLGKMQDVTGEGRTVLFVSHNMGTVSELCERAILLRDGCLVEDGPTRKVTSHYLSSASLSTEADMDVSAPSLRRNSLPNSRFRWTRAAILDLRHRPTAMLSFGEPFELLLYGNADTELSEVRVGFSVDTMLGFAVFNSFQLDAGILSQIPAGRTLFRVRIQPNILAPGAYKISLGAMGPGVLDFLPSTLQFEISTAGAAESSGWKSHHAGVVAAPCKWYIERGDSDAT